MNEELQLHEARTTDGKLPRYLRLVFPVKALLVGAFGFATVAALLALDWRYALAWSLTGTVALGSLVFTASSLLALRRHWRRAVVGYLAAFVVSLCVVLGVLFSGKVNDIRMPLVQAVSDSMFLKLLLEEANQKGLAPADWRALENHELIQPGAATSGKYYEREDIRWALGFDNAGKFTGTIHFRGNSLHNIPDCDAHINERGRPVVKAGEYKRYIPVRPKDMK